MSQHLSGAIWLVDQQGNNVTNANVVFTSQLTSVDILAKVTTAGPPQNGDYNKWVCHVDAPPPAGGNGIYQLGVAFAVYSVTAPGYKPATGSIPLVQANYAVVLVTLVPVTPPPPPKPTVNSWNLYLSKVTVTDANTGAPLNATCTFAYSGKTYSYTTDATGKAIVGTAFSFTGPISATLIVEASGYTAIQRLILVTPIVPSAPTTPTTSYNISLSSGQGDVNDNQVAEEDYVTATGTTVPPGLTQAQADAMAAAGIGTAAPATSSYSITDIIIFLVVLFILYKIFTSGGGAAPAA